VHADTISRVLRKPSPNAADWQAVRDALYQLPFENVDQKIVHSSGVMKQLLRIEEDCFDIPEDISLDAQMILKRWRNGDYDPHLLRGIDLNQTITHVKGRGAKNVKRTRHYKLEEDYDWKRDDNVEGNHELFVGEWWPLQICALRDGAHGEMEAGKFNFILFLHFLLIIPLLTYFLFYRHFWKYHYRCHLRYCLRRCPLSGPR